MVGTLVKTETIHGFFIGMIKSYFYRDLSEEIVIDVTWNDCDETTETFNEYEDYDSYVYHFYDNGRWWQVDENFYKFKELLEGEWK